MNAHGLRYALNARMLRRLGVMAAVMFGFGFALVPFYRALCEATGINVLTTQDADVVKNTQVDASRNVTVEFDANSQGPWQFKPQSRSIDVHPGELTTITYEIANTQSRPMIGQAIPSYMPTVAAQYFKKVECFCFQQQTLAANTTRRFPVVFYVDPKLPRDVTSITLSYTFFEIPGAGTSTAPRGTGAPAAG